LGDYVAVTGEPGRGHRGGRPVHVAYAPRAKIELRKWRERGGLP
jgi:hypothetical protein